MHRSTHLYGGLNNLVLHFSEWPFLRLVVEAASTHIEFTPYIRSSWIFTIFYFFIFFMMLSRKVLDYPFLNIECLLSSLTGIFLKDNVRHIVGLMAVVAAFWLSHLGLFVVFMVNTSGFTHFYTILDWGIRLFTWYSCHWWDMDYFVIVSILFSM